MKELIDKYINNGLADFEGLEIAGSVPIKQELINEAIASFLQDAGETPSAPTGGKAAGESASKAGSKSGSSLPVKALIGMVKRAEVQAVEGKVIFHFTIKR